MKIGSSIAVSLIWLCSLQQTALGKEALQCKTGLFFRPQVFVQNQNDLRNNSEFQTELISLRMKANAALKMTPNPYFGHSSFRYLDQGRRDILAAMNLALSSVLDESLNAKGASRKAAELLLAWAATGIPGQFPGAKPMNKDEYRDYAGLGLYTSAMAIGVAQTYQLLLCGGALTNEEANSIRAWLRRLLSYIFEGRQIWEKNGYFGGQLANNHLSTHNLAVYTLGVVLEDISLREWAYRSERNRRNFLSMIRLAIYDGQERVKDIRDKVGSLPKRGEIYDRYRMSDNGKGLHYAFVHLRSLSQLAEAATIQGERAFEIRGSNNVTLTDAVLYYGELLADKPCQLNSAPVVGEETPNYKFYIGAKINAVYWNWLLPAVFGLSSDARIARLSSRLSINKCAPAAPEYMPIPVFPVVYALSSFQTK